MIKERENEAIANKEILDEKAKVKKVIYKFIFSIVKCILCRRHVIEVLNAI